MATVDAKTAAPITWLPPELLAHIVEMAVEGLPSTVHLRAATLRTLSLVARAWVEPAQRALESKVHIDSYGRAQAYLDRPRTLDRPLVLDELVLFFDFAPQDDDFYPLSDFQTRTICEMDGEIRSLHLRATLFMNSFDLNLLLLPSFRGLRHLKLSIPLEVPAGLEVLPLRLERLSLSAMVDQPTGLFRTLLASSQETLTALDLFVIKSGSPLHERLIEALPSLPSRLRQISITTHWVPLSDSLVDLIASCTSLCTLALDGVITKEVLGLLPRLSSQSLVALDLAVPATFTWYGSPIESFFDRILREASTRSLRFLTATRRIESSSDERPERRDMRRGKQGCHCVYEVTARRPLP
ncbi:hypothetical protein JCM10449v2_003186 [Rhodotorula kratochvilovae]